jgi:hypothetical protein
MNIPINCPICHDPLVNAFNDSTDKVVYKNCRLRPDHIFSCAVFLKGFMDYEIDTLNRVAFTISMSPLLSATIYVDGITEVIEIDKCAPNKSALLSNDAKAMPFYVEPTFEDFPKLCQKIKTYILFS